MEGRGKGHGCCFRLTGCGGLGHKLSPSPNIAVRQPGAAGSDTTDGVLSIAGCYRSPSDGSRVGVSKHAQTAVLG
eukprot:4382906-Prymnesium_polylepis.1